MPIRGGERGPDRKTQRFSAQPGWPQAQRPLLLWPAALWLTQLLLQNFPFAGASHEHDWCWHFMGVSSLTSPRACPVPRVGRGLDETRPLAGRA